MRTQKRIKSEGSFFLLFIVSGHSLAARPDLLRGFQGAFFGCAIGDALGLPFEGLGPNVLWDKREALVKRFSPHPSGFFPPGQFSDDTQLTVALAEAIIERKEVDGAVIAQHFAKLWETGEIIGKGFSCDYAMQNVLRGVTWDEAGAPEGRAGNGTAMRASPIGLWNYDRIDQISADSRIQSIVTHQDPRAIAGATAVATAVALNLSHPNLDTKSTNEKYLETIGKAIFPIQEEFGAAILKLVDFFSMPLKEAISAIRTEGYTESSQPDWPGISPYVIPTVLLALFSFLRTPKKFLETIALTIGAGGDVDTTSAIAGTLSGAFNGLDELPKNLRETVVNKGQLAATADNLYRAAISR